MTVRRYDEKLEEAVKSASNENIVFFCSTEDVGASRGGVYPASWPEWTYSISETDTGGKEVQSTDRHARYYFPGVNISTEGLSYKPSLTGQSGYSGSSIATAVASGTASLILSCRNLAKSDSTKSRKKSVEMVFEAMKNVNDKYVDPGTFFREDQSGLGKWSQEDWMSFIDRRFGPKGAYA